MRERAERTEGARRFNRMGRGQRRHWHIDAGTAMRGARRAGALQAARMPGDGETSTFVLPRSIRQVRSGAHRHHQ
jgi:hypothetical protein